MGARRASKLPVIPPNMQIAFYYRLQDIRNLYLHEAMKNTIQNMDLKVVDGELGSFVKLIALT